MNKFCDTQTCEGHSFEFKTYKANNSFWKVIREYYVLNLVELNEWFECLCWQKDILCCCSADSPVCYSCFRFDYIEKELEKVCYFARNAVLFDGIRRPIKWQIHTNYEHPRRKFKFAVFIEESILNIKLKHFFFLFVVLN